MAETAAAYGDRPLPATLAPLGASPADAVARLCDLLDRYWQLALADHWPKDACTTAGRRALPGATDGRRRRRAAVRRHRPECPGDGEALHIDKRADATLELHDQGVVLVPSLFVWPQVIVITDPGWQPTIVYPARGVGTLWEQVPRDATGALGALLGDGRAAVLRRLDEPWSTTDLARTLRLAPSGVSAHLATLREAGLVHGHRVGRSVLYMRSPLGDALAGAGDAG